MYPVHFALKGAVKLLGRKFYEKAHKACSSIGAYGCNAGSSHVIDSSGGNGVLRVENVGENILLFEKNKAMPLQDRIAGGYRFFEYDLQLDPETEEDSTAVRKFWYRFTFDNLQAYTLLAEHYPGLTIGAEVFMNNTRLLGVTFGAGDSLNERDFAASWASRMLERPNTTWLYTRISGMNKISSSGAVGVKPWIRSCGVRAQVASGEKDMITYSVLEIHPGFAPHT